MLTVAAMFTLSRISLPLLTRLPFNTQNERAIVGLASIGVSFVSVLLLIVLAILAASARTVAKPRFLMANLA
jgi:hypothetical protein